MDSYIIHIIRMYTLQLKICITDAIRIQNNSIERDNNIYLSIGVMHPNLITHRQYILED